MESKKLVPVDGVKNLSNLSAFQIESQLLLKLCLCAYFRLRINFG